MENLIEIKKSELIHINGGHNGTAYEIGEIVGEFFRDAFFAFLGGKAGSKVRKR